MTLTTMQIVTLKSCRQKAMTVESLRDAYREAAACADGIKSPSMNGMPCVGGSSLSAYDRAIAKRDKLAAQLRRAEESLGILRTQAEKVIMTAIDDKYTLFADLYYVQAMEVDEIAEVTGKAEKTIRAYRKRIEGKTV